MEVNILGIRGIPAAHGGFETFASHLAPYLRDKGHRVLVYCQGDPGDPRQAEDEWEGIRRVHFTPKRTEAAGTIEFDFACVRDVVKRPGVDLVLGYNTAIFNVLQRVRGRRIVMNMDGIEWKRAKWSFSKKVWLFANEVIGANISHISIADHPEIARHCTRRSINKPVMIPYGADTIDSAPASYLEKLDLESGKYFISIARIEPENSILELVRAYSKLDLGVKCVILGKLDPENSYHRAVRDAAQGKVFFPGAIYESEYVSALRYHALAYLHGHQVGGTNPSLVEALGAGSVILAHKNKFNLWTAGRDQFFFASEAEIGDKMTQISENGAPVEDARRAARERHARQFKWQDILGSYEDVLMDQYRKSGK